MMNDLTPAPGRILVTGATGHVGGELVTELAARGHAVRAISRRPEAARLPPGVEVVRADLEDGASLDEALAGVEGMFLMTTQFAGNAREPEHVRLAVDAARRAKVQRIVFLSVLAGGDKGDDPIARFSNAAETAVMSSGVPWTLLRPGRFMSNALHWAPMIRRGGQVHVPFADLPLASIDPADIASVARAALTEPGHEGKAYPLSGPEALTPAEEVAILARTLGRSLEVVALSPDAARTGLLRSGMTEEVVDAIVRRTEARTHGGELLSTVRDVTGRAPRTFADWARAHAEAFR